MLCVWKLHLKNKRKSIHTSTIIPGSIFTRLLIPCFLFLLFFLLYSTHYTLIMTHFLFVAHVLLLRTNPYEHPKELHLGKKVYVYVLPLFQGIIRGQTQKVCQHPTVIICFLLVVLLLLPVRPRKQKFIPFFKYNFVQWQRPVSPAYTGMPVYVPEVL